MMIYDKLPRSMLFCFRSFLTFYVTISLSQQTDATMRRAYAALARFFEYLEPFRILQTVILPLVPLKWFRISTTM